MTHLEYEPQPALRHDVKCLWTIEESPAVYNRDDILPDSSVDLIVNIGAPLATEDGHELPRAFLKGLQTKPLRLRTTGLCQIVGIRLHPWAVPSLVGVQDSAPLVPLDGRWRDLASTLETAVRRSGYEEAANTLEQFVIETRRREHADLSPLRTAGEMIYDSSGQIRMAAIAAHAYLSPSQLERRFKQLTGVSPKTFARLVRFEAARNSLFMDPAYPPAKAALDFGYTDQAHFIHDFKAFADRTPGALTAQLQDAGFLQYG